MVSSGSSWLKTTFKFVAKFNTNDASKVERALTIKQLILNEESQPRSGAGRAAADEQKGK